ncbi:MAG: hypothetical protein K6G29_03900 [Clostridiales bacterium]|nr:hypothetical protein [Clostridiales bacterium]
MKTRILTLAAILLALCLLAACTEEKPNDPGTDVTDAALAEADAEFANGYTVKLDNGVSITLGAVADDTLAALGEPSDVMEAPSCIHTGTDRVYTYSGRLTLTTQPDAAGRDRITEITFLSDAVAMTENGTSVMIGSDASAADAAFGEPYESSGGISRYFADRVLSGIVNVTVDGGEITALSVNYVFG